MDGEPYYRRFLSVVVAFVRSIVLLIFMSTLYGTLIGWDGLGITSFLLVIYYKNRKSLGRSLITALTNRVGDAFLLVLLGLSLYPRGGGHLSLVLLLITAMTKRAQYPFSRWLPAAIAAPTPVRALVHSSTLVTAGIYLLLRFNSSGTEWLLSLGSVTLLIAGLCACGEIDIKKIVALSTLSQLGVMAVALALSLKALSFFHLITHAIFKALLFICVGVGIHTVFGTQDFRTYGGLTQTLPWPSAFLCTANLALLGFPFLAGFYSKDSILESFYNCGNGTLPLGIFLLGVGLTTSYSTKIVSLSLATPGGIAPACLNAGGTVSPVKLPLLRLGAGAVLGGAGLACGFGSGAPVLAPGDKSLPLVLIGVGVAVGCALGRVKAHFLSRMWDLTPAYQDLARGSAQMRSLRVLDEGAGEAMGGPGWLIFLLGSQLTLYPALALGSLYILPLVL